MSDLASGPRPLAECDVDAALAQRLAESFFGTAEWMRNRGG